MASLFAKRTDHHNPTAAVASQSPEKAEQTTIELGGQHVSNQEQTPFGHTEIMHLRLRQPPDDLAHCALVELVLVLGDVRPVSPVDEPAHSRVDDLPYETAVSQSLQ